MSYPNCDPSVPIYACTTRASVPTTITLDIPRYCPYVKHNSFTRLHSVAPTATGTWGDSNSLADFYSPFPCKMLKSTSSGLAEPNAFPPNSRALGTGKSSLCRRG